MVLNLWITASLTTLSPKIFASQIIRAAKLQVATKILIRNYQRVAALGMLRSTALREGACVKEEEKARGNLLYLTLEMEHKEQSLLQERAESLHSENQEVMMVMN